MTGRNKHGLMNDSYINVETQCVKSLSVRNATHLTGCIATLRHLEGFGKGKVCTSEGIFQPPVHTSLSLKFTWMSVFATHYFAQRVASELRDQ